jgi:hypothetical protein
MCWCGLVSDAKHRRHHLELGVAGQCLGARPSRELLGVAGGDRPDTVLVLGAELLTGLDETGDPASVHGVGAHEATVVAGKGCRGRLLVLGLQLEENDHDLTSEAEVRLDVLFDLGFGLERIAVAVAVNCRLGAARCLVHRYHLQLPIPCWQADLRRIANVR